MKAIVLYYSQTGNTARIAEAIHSGIRDVLQRCEIARMKDVDPARDLASYDLIGIGSPVINLREPTNVGRFIEALEGVDGKLAFAYCTHGALPAYYFARVVPALAQRGLRIVGWKDWFGAAVYPVVPKPYFTDGHPDEIDLQEAGEFGREMARLCKAILRGDNVAIPRFPTGKEYDAMYYPVKPPEPAITTFRKFEARMQFTVDPDKCRYPRCTRCIDHCPMGSIDLSVSPAIFDKDCMRCYQCVMNCPHNAIVVDWAGFQEVHDPLTTEWLQKSLEVFEAQGRFRRLVPMERIGWDTPVWKLKLAAKGGLRGT